MSSITPKNTIGLRGIENPNSIGAEVLAGKSAGLTEVSQSVERVETQSSEFNAGLDGQIQNIVEGTQGNLDQGIRDLTTTNPPEDIKNSIRQDIQDGNYNAAAAKTVPYSDKSESELAVNYSNLSSTIASTRVISADNSVMPDPYIIGDNVLDWSGSNTQGYSFDYINSYEELLSELKSIKREVTTVIVHWTDTYTNKNLTAEQVHDGQVALGMDGIGYHYVIRRDGTLQRGRPIDIDGEHTTSHNSLSIAIAFVGGYNCPSGTPNPEIYKSAESLTRAQFNTFDSFLEVFYRYYAGGQVLGHNDIDENEDDPGFDVVNYCRNRFGKGTLHTIPRGNDSFTTLDINQQGIPGAGEGTVTYTLEY